MKINKNLFNAETINSCISDDTEKYDSVIIACNYEANLMRIDLNDEQIKKFDSKLRSADASEKDKEAAQEKKDKLMADNAFYKQENAESEPTYLKVLNAISSAKNEYVQNDVNAVRNVLRLVACTENSKFFKYAILGDANLATMKELFDSVHTSVDCDENGRPVYYATVWNNHAKIKDEIEKLLKRMFFIPVENEYTDKVSIKFNRTDLHMLHEAYVTGIKVDYKKDKEGKFESAKTGLRTAIQSKKNRQGETTYSGTTFVESIAKLAFNHVYGK